MVQSSSTSKGIVEGKETEKVGRVVSGPTLPTNSQMLQAQQEMRRIIEREREAEEVIEEELEDFGPKPIGQDQGDDKFNNFRTDEEKKEGFGSHKVLESLFGDLLEENIQKEREEKLKKQSNYTLEQEEEMANFINKKRGSLPSLIDSHAEKVSKRQRTGMEQDSRWDRDRDMGTDIGGVKKLSNKEANEMVVKAQNLSSRFSKPSFL